MYTYVCRRYVKLFLVQQSLSNPGVTEEQLERASDEQRRAVTFKATETFLEAAPQLLMQVYITYKRESADTGDPYVHSGGEILSSVDFTSILKLDLVK